MASFRVKATGVKEFIDEANRAIAEITSQTIMDNLGRMARDIIFRRVKSGKGVADDQDTETTQTTLLPLRPSYIKYRSKLAALGSFASARKSNLTLTGQMLDSIEVEARRNGFTLKIPESLREDGKDTNANVAKYVRDGGRPFFQLTVKEQTILFRELEKKLRAELSRKLGRR